MTVRRNFVHDPLAFAALFGQDGPFPKHHGGFASLIIGAVLAKRILVGQDPGWKNGWTVCHITAPPFWNSADYHIWLAVTKEDIQAHFKDGPGNITEIKLMNGFGFIEYDNALDARDVVPGMRESQTSSGMAANDPDYLAFRTYPPSFIPTSRRIDSLISARMRRWV